MFSKTLSYPNDTLTIFPDFRAFITNAAKSWIELCNQSILAKGSFFVALSGGSTPQEIYREIIRQKKTISDVSKIFLFWGDERQVAPTNTESNYFQATSILSELQIPSQNIFYMKAENALQAEDYEATIKSLVPDSSFDLIMLGMGEDGHTASLFPNTEALRENVKLVFFNRVPQKNIYRMTLTYPCFKKAKNIYIYVAGSSKSMLMKTIFVDSQKKYPINYVSSRFNKNTWLIDCEAGKFL